jgi:hypothetical protein
MVRTKEISVKEMDAEATMEHVFVWMRRLWMSTTKRSVLRAAFSSIKAK